MSVVTPLRRPSRQSTSLAGREPPQLGAEVADRHFIAERHHRNRVVSDGATTHAGPWAIVAHPEMGIRSLITETLHYGSPRSVCPDHRAVPSL